MKNYFEFRHLISRSEQRLSGNFIDLNAEDETMESLLQGNADRYRSIKKDQAPAGMVGQYASWEDALLFGKNMKIGDIVFMPPGMGRSHRVGMITSEYTYCHGAEVPHRRSIQWFPLIAAKAIYKAGSDRARFTFYDWMGGSAEVEWSFETEVANGETQVNGYSAIIIKLERSTTNQLTGRDIKLMGTVAFEEDGVEVSTGQIIFMTGTTLRHSWGLSVVPPILEVTQWLIGELTVGRGNDTPRCG
ncbi:MAG: hypothetical protein V4731_06230 [Pseudomonadota bacterium]